MENFKQSSQGPRTEAGAFRAAEHKENREEEMKRLVEKYQNVQAQLTTLREDMKKGMEHAAQQSDPRIDDLALEIRQGMQAQIDDLEIEKEEAEIALRGKGGNPSDYTLQ